MLGSSYLHVNSLLIRINMARICSRDLSDVSFKLIAVYVNWQNFHEQRSDRGFCLSGKGLCDDCLKS